MVAPVLPTTSSGQTLCRRRSTKIFAAPGSADTPLAIGTNLRNEGNGQAHNNMQPYLVINYLIAIQGIFPSRD